VNDLVVPAGYELRRCLASDIDAVAEFHSRRTHPFDGEDFRLIAEDPEAGPGWSAIVLEKATGKVVANLTLLDEIVRVGTTLVPSGQVELIASDTAHEGRGLVRALMGWSAEESLRRGHLLQPMVGIPYFYRQFGYEYAIKMASWATVTSIPRPTDDDVTVRLAELGDSTALIDLHDAEQRLFDISMGHSPTSWNWILSRAGSLTWVAERDGHIVASARSLPDAEGAAVGELSARDADAALSLLAHLADGKPELLVQYRPQTLAGQAIADLVAGQLQPERDADWAYIRIPDLAALLNHLRPELQRRLDDADLAELPDRLLISTYRSSVVAELTDGQVGPFEPGGPVHSPVSAGGVGVPPDAIGSLLVGTVGALELERQRPDVHLGVCRDLMAALFGPRSVDLETFYLAV
jgi:predicted N-acetyltransferase YhbS